MTPLVFAPDADPTTPGVIVSCENLIPSTRGYQDAPSFEAPGIIFLPGTGKILNSYGYRPLDGIQRFITGTSNALYRMGIEGSFSSAYSAVQDEESPWSIRQVGDVTLAARNNQQIVAATTGAFSAVSGAPDANFLCVASGVVMALNYDGITDGWIGSQPYNYTNWVPDLATRSADGRLLDTAGPITAAHELGPYVIAFKEYSTYVMRFVGGNVIWATECVSNEIGCAAPQSIVDIGDRLLFVGSEDFYVFDGTRPRAIPGSPREFIFGNDVNTGFNRLTRARRNEIRAVFDGRLVYWYYPLVTSDVDTNAVVYDTITGRWGHVNTPLYAPLVLTRFISDTINIQPFLAGFAADRRFGYLWTRSNTAKFRMGWYGDDAVESTLTKWRPRFRKWPSQAIARYFESNDAEESIPKGSAVVTDRRFDTRQNARWHSVEMELRGPFEITGLGSDLPRPGGRR